MPAFEDTHVCPRRKADARLALVRVLHERIAERDSADSMTRLAAGWPGVSAGVWAEKFPLM
jgi:hypothetical protein